MCKFNRRLFTYNLFLLTIILKCGWGIPLGLLDAFNFGNDDYDLHYDQRQNGSENYRLHLDGLLLLVALPGSSSSSSGSTSSSAGTINAEDFIFGNDLFGPFGKDDNPVNNLGEHKDNVYIYDANSNEEKDKIKNFESSTMHSILAAPPYFDFNHRFAERNGDNNNNRRIPIGKSPDMYAIKEDEYKERRMGFRLPNLFKIFGRSNNYA